MHGTIWTWREEKASHAFYNLQSSLEQSLHSHEFQSHKTVSGNDPCFDYIRKRCLHKVWSWLRTAKQKEWRRCYTLRAEILLASNVKWKYNQSLTFVFRIRYSDVKVSLSTHSPRIGASYTILFLPRVGNTLDKWARSIQQKKKKNYLGYCLATPLNVQ